MLSIDWNSQQEIELSLQSVFRPLYIRNYSFCMNSCLSIFSSSEIQKLYAKTFYSQYNIYFKSVFASSCHCNKLPQSLLPKAIQIYSLRALEVKVLNGFYGAKIKTSVGLLTFGNSEGESVSCFFQLLEAAFILWLFGLFVPCFYHNITFSLWLWFSCLPFIKTLVILLGPPT